MDYVFRLADGRRLVLWSEKNQVIRQLSGGGGNRSQLVLRTDFLSDLSAISMEGKLYYVYQNTSRRVVLALPEGDEEKILFGESIERCRHGGLTLAESDGELYLFYTAWSPIRECYSLNVCKPLSRGEEQGLCPGGEIPAIALIRDREVPPAFSVISDGRGVKVIAGRQCFELCHGENGEQWEQKQLEAEAEIQQLRGSSDRLKERALLLEQQCRQLEEKIQRTEKQSEELQDRLNTAVTQYNELAQVARQLQIEGKKWRDKYYQETKKDRVRTLRPE